MFLVTTNSSEQDIDASIRHADMREEAKDRVEMERALSGATDAPIFEFQVLNQVCVMLDPMLAYAVINDSPDPHKKSDVILDVTSAEHAVQQWVDGQPVS